MALSASEIPVIADQLDAAGTTPTLAAVRRALGGGSFTTISEAMQTLPLRNTRLARMRDSCYAVTRSTHCILLYVAV